MIKLDARQSIQANDGASIVKRAKERFRNYEVFGALYNTSAIIGLY